VSLLSHALPPIQEPVSRVFVVKVCVCLLSHALPPILDPVSRVCGVRLCVSLLCHALPPFRSQSAGCVSLECVCVSSAH